MTEAKIAKILLETRAVKLSPSKPFKWSSGWSSPIYCDNRTVLSFAAHRTAIKKMMSERIAIEFPTANAIIGVATAGIAMGALVADEMNSSYAYCRPKPKEHGLQRQLEGQMDKDAKIVVIEDLISTGGSSLKVVEYLRNEGYNVLGMAAIFTYGFDLADDNFRNENCKYFTLGNYASLIKQALVENYIQADDLEALDAWRADPANWGK